LRGRTIAPPESASTSTPATSDVPSTNNIQKVYGKSMGMGKKSSKSSSKSSKNSGKKSSKKSGSSGSIEKNKDQQNQNKTAKLRITATNLAYAQPLSAIFVMVHNNQAAPLFEFGSPASESLALLAEFGDAQSLVEAYENKPGVSYVGIYEAGSPYLAGDKATIDVTVTKQYRHVTIATMATNTNDCFIALNGERIKPGDVFELPGLDAGTEENNELCSSMPGQACDDIDTTNVRSGNGEGVVHVHRGFQGIGDLRRDQYDWRNPMVHVAVSRL
jgi:hypothetical protein